LGLLEKCRLLQFILKYILDIEKKPSSEIKLTLSSGEIPDLFFIEGLAQFSNKKIIISCKY